MEMFLIMYLDEFTNEHDNTIIGINRKKNLKWNFKNGKSN